MTSFGFIFAQIFTIIGLGKHAGVNDEFVAIHLVYALIEIAVEQNDTDPCLPTKIMSDFELAIINACKQVFPYVPASGWFFYLG